MPGSSAEHRRRRISVIGEPQQSIDENEMKPETAFDESLFRLSDEDENHEEKPKTAFDESVFQLSDQDEDEEKPKTAFDESVQLSDQDEDQEKPEPAFDESVFELSDEDEDQEKPEPAFDESVFELSDEDEHGEEEKNDESRQVQSQQPKQGIQISEIRYNRLGELGQDPQPRPVRNTNRFIFNSGCTEVMEPPPVRYTQIHPTDAHRRIGPGAQVCSNVQNELLRQITFTAPDDNWDDDEMEEAEARRRNRRGYHGADKNKSKLGGKR